MNKKQNAAVKAADFIKDGMILGLGTGSTVFFLFPKLHELIRKGLRLQCVATSKSTEDIARELQIPLVSIDTVSRIDLVIDGVDEIDPEYNAIKGGGGALLREKIVASLADEVIWIMDDSKLVQSLGKFPLPVEIVKFGYLQTIAQMQQRGLNPVLRLKDANPYVTDNDHYLVDLHLGAGFDIKATENTLKGIVGVVETGLFLNTCKMIVVGTDEGAEIVYNHNK
jgi:ribose 5-phosphate isomerase A